MKYLIPFNESFSNKSDLRLNIESTTKNGLEIIQKEDPSIEKMSESSFIRRATKNDNINGSFIMDGILRIRITGPRDLFGRSGGATYISLREPQNFDYELFKNRISSVTHEGGVTKPESVNKVIDEIKNIIIECSNSGYSIVNYEESPEENIYEDQIMDVVNQIKSEIGVEEIKKILNNIISKL